MPLPTRLVPTRARGALRPPHRQTLAPLLRRAPTPPRPQEEPPVPFATASRRAQGEARSGARRASDALPSRPCVRRSSLLGDDALRPRSSRDAPRAVLAPYRAKPERSLPWPRESRPPRTPRRGSEGEPREAGGAQRQPHSRLPDRKRLARRSKRQSAPARWSLRVHVGRGWSPRPYPAQSARKAAHGASLLPRGRRSLGTQWKDECSSPPASPAPGPSARDHAGRSPGAGKEDLRREAGRCFAPPDIRLLFAPRSRGFAT